MRKTGCTQGSEPDDGVRQFAYCKTGGQKPIEFLDTMFCDCEKAAPCFSLQTQRKGRLERYEYQLNSCSWLSLVVQSCL